MKIKDLAIGFKLVLSLGALLALVFLVNSVSIIQSYRLGSIVSDMYEHPLMVRRALGEIRFNIASIRYDMLSLLLNLNKDEVDNILRDIDNKESDIAKYTNVMASAYLGPKDDIDEVTSSMAQWRSVRNETLHLFRENNIDEVSKRLGINGAEQVKELELMKELNDVHEFSLKRSESYYADAISRRQNVLIGTISVSLLIFILTLFVGYSLFVSIRVPMDALLDTVKKYKNGDLEARVSYSSEDEFGILSDAFNELANSMYETIKRRDRASVLASNLVRADGMRTFCRSMLQDLLCMTESQMGVVYFLSEDKQRFEHYESIGLSDDSPRLFSALNLEGELGITLLTKQVQHVQGIMPSTGHKIYTSLGSFVPRDMLTIPILFQDNVTAIISLASVGAYDATKINLIHDTLNLLTFRMNSFIYLQRIKDFSERLEHQNLELQNQKRAISSQKDELYEQNVELELQKRQLDDANKLKSTFLSNMSHELRTPLNSVIGLTGVLRRRLKGAIPKDEYSYLSVIKRNGESLLTMINDILDLARIEAGRETINVRAFTVVEVIQSVVEMLQHAADKRSISLIVSIDESIPIVKNDYNKCVHIIQNLVSNAIKFTNEGSITIQASSTDQFVIFSVIDTGIGIDPAQIDYIFNEFCQADASSTRHYGGTGLGLAIARKYSELMGGEISVESELNKGSKFTVTLPLRLDTNVIVETCITDVENVPRLHTDDSNCILVVEDNEPTIIQIMDILEDESYQIYIARNGREAIEKIRYITPNAIILDLMMPDVDGFEVLESIRSIDRTARVPVLILTAKHLTTDELNRIKGNNVHQLIQKGNINREFLLESIRKLMNENSCRVEKVKKVSIPKRPSILVIEDNADNRLMIRAVLQTDFDIIEACNGKEGLDKILELKPDLILMDLSMPIIDGYETFNEVRKYPEFSHTPIIALTADAMVGSKDKIINHGFDGYISKPINEQEFIQVIKEQLDVI